MDEETVKEVKIALIRREWTQGDLSFHIGVSQAYLSLILNGRREVPWIEQRVLTALGLKERPSGSQRGNGPEKRRRNRGRVAAT